MGAVTKCSYQDCYYNHNLKNLCLRKIITLDFYSTCENIMHCDEYVCNACERFLICTKEKKSASNLTPVKQERIVLRYSKTVQIEYCDNAKCVYCRASKCVFSGGIALDTNATCMMTEYPEEGTQQQEKEESPPDKDVWFKQI